MRFLVVLSLILFVGILWSCSSSQDDLGKIADSLEDRLSDALDFDYGEPQSDLPPESSSNAPAIASISGSELRLGAPFAFTLETPYTGEGLDRVIVYVDGATKHIRVEAKAVKGVLMISGLLGDDEKLRGRKFKLQFAIGTSTGVLGPYGFHEIEILDEETQSSGKDIDALEIAGEVAHKSGRPAGSDDADAPQISALHGPSKLASGQAFRVKLDSDFPDDISGVILTTPRNEAYKFIPAQLEDGSANISGVLSENLEVGDRLAFLLALQAGALTGAYKAWTLKVVEPGAVADGDTDAETLEGAEADSYGETDAEPEIDEEAETDAADGDAEPEIEEDIDNTENDVEAVYNLLEAWHVPQNAEPAGATMRKPLFPAPGQTTLVYAGAQPVGVVYGGALYWRLIGDEEWDSDELDFDVAESSGEYWYTRITPDAGATGVEYYFELEGEPGAYDATYIYGANDGSQVSGREAEAVESPFVFTYPVVVDGDEEDDIEIEAEDEEAAPECENNDDCDDGNVCTDDICNEEAQCEYILVVGIPCEDDNACTIGDYCDEVAGEAVCVAGVSSLSCDDANDCTRDSCNETLGCQHVALTGHICNDGNLCTIGDYCNEVAGEAVCVAGVSSLSCDDGNYCNGAESCDAALGCLADSAPECSDNGVCNVDGVTCDCDEGYDGDYCEQCAAGYTDYPDCRPLIKQGDAGSSNTCVVTENGGVKCWGSNGFGQLGDGTMIDSGLPVDVSGLHSGVVAVSAESGHTCAVLESGGVKCWGSNNSGELGDGTKTDSSTPVDVSGLSNGVVAVSAGGAPSFVPNAHFGHSCAVLESGGIKCWGYNYSGQLGNGTTTSSSTPVDVSVIDSVFKTVSSGGNHTCAVLENGGVKCWGKNDKGQLGDGTTTDSSTPVDVNELGSGIVAISSGRSHSCAVLESGGIKCWGYNYSGQLGNGTTTSSSTPVDVSAIDSVFKTVSSGGNHTCAVLENGGVKCWGYNRNGQLGDGTQIDSSIPVDVNGSTSGVIAVIAGISHTCELHDNGIIRCWGANSNNQLGNGIVFNSGSSANVIGLEGEVLSVSAGNSHSCAVVEGGGLKCWGGNTFGQLGNGTKAPGSLVDVIALSTGVAAVSAGDFHTCAVLESGGVKCWGSNNSGELGDGTTTDSSAPVDVSGLTSGVLSVSAGCEHTCAVLESGALKCWGSNTSGKLGNGTNTDSHAPVGVNGLNSGVVAVAAGTSHTCALLNSGGLKCWGSNISGQLGDGTTTYSYTPVDVSALSSGVLAVSTGDNYTCAVPDDGSLKCWGRNSWGQLGNGTITNSSIPIDVIGLSSGVVSVSARSGSTCAVLENGDVKCWGYNGSGELGDGTTTNASIPVDVSSLNSDVMSVSVGGAHACVILESRAVKCWGDNSSGQLGDGTAWSTIPVEVVWR